MAGSIILILGTIFANSDVVNGSILMFFGALLIIVSFIIYALLIYSGKKAKDIEANKRIEPITIIGVLGLKTVKLKYTNGY